MAMLLPQCAPPESLHHQLSATIRQRRLYHPASRRGARATHGATESSTHASCDHFRVPSSEPCCNLMSPLVMMTPKKPVRRSSRLRVRKGRTDDFMKTDTPTDMDAAEWISRVLANNNGVVEVDPVTMAEQMRQYQQVKHDTDYSDYTSGSSHESSGSQDFFPPGASLRFPKVPLGVALAAGSAVALALVAFLIQSLSKKQGDGGSSKGSDSLTSGFSGEPVRSSGGSPPSPPQRPTGNKGPAEVLAAGAAVATGRLPKTGDPKTRSQDKYASVTPFFASDRATVSSSGATPTSASRWQEDKYKSVRPFFPSDKLAQPVTPFFADDRTGSAKAKAVTPAQGKGSSSYESVPPFFPVAKSGSSKVVTPFFADDKEQQGKRAHGKGPSYESVPPFFADEQQARNGPSYKESVAPFFPDEQQTRNGSSYMESVPPFFPDEQQPSTGRSYMESVPPFFPDEQQTSTGRSYMETVPPFFADERPKTGSSLQDVTPFFGSEAKPRSYMETVPPFFADERQGGSGSVDWENVKPFFPDDRPGSSGAQRDSSAMSSDERILQDLFSGPMRSEGKQLLTQMAGGAQGPHEAFMAGTTAGRMNNSNNNNGDFSFQGQAKAPFKDVTLQLSPEELAILAEIKAEEERRHAKMQALQSAFPALAVGAGAIGAGLVGVDGAFEMVGLTATASFISYELLWANKRQELLDEISRITDHHKLFRFLQKRKIVKDDC